MRYITSGLLLSLGVACGPTMQDGSAEIYDGNRIVGAAPIAPRPRQPMASMGQRGPMSQGAVIQNGMASADLMNCDSFSTDFEAQQYFLRMGGPARDPSNLDLDGDGNACEWGTEPARSAPVTSACMVGPRGGTYMLVNGRKDYDAC